MPNNIKYDTHLSTSHIVNSCDTAMLDTEVLFNNLDHWSKTIGCAGSVGHQLKCT
jgi:hypothetical protein